MLKQSLTHDLDFELDPAFRRRATYIINWVNKFKPKRILDVGCGRGFYERMVTDFPELKMVGLEINTEYLKKALQNNEHKRVRFVNGSATELPFKKEQFDGVICSEILEHLTDDRKALKEIFRVLRSGGQAVITVPNNYYPFWWDPINKLTEKLFQWHFPSNIWWLAGIWADHKRLYSEREIKKIATEAGMSILDFERCTKYCLPFIHFFLYGLGKNLVERGLANNFDRFNPDKQNSRLRDVILKIINYFDDRNKFREIKPGEEFVNMVMLVEK